ncbi:MAG TPA: POTRA domain-containing protein [Bryobacteraceae bacterium]|jgi:outer membrane protein assembly complex protein YaeT|nr:POTRA domain-containing protein [Bryobacteraceae bacterium]
MGRAGYAFYPTLVLCSFVIFSPALLGEASVYEGKRVARIVFVPREQPLEPEELHKILPVKENTPLRLESIRAAIDRLYATGTYADIQVDAELQGNAVILRFITQNTWFIGGVSADGKIKQPPTPGQLVNASRLELGALQTEEKVQQGISGMRQLFESNGFYRSRVQPRYSYDQPTNQVRINFDVDSGVRARYSTPDVDGDLKMPKEKVISATRWKGWFGWKKVTEARTQKGLDNVRNRYLKQDRLLARVTLEKMEFNEDSQTVSPTLQIRAGPKVAIKTIGANVSRGKLQRYVPVFEERTVDRDLLVEGQRNLRDYFQSRGYFDAEVEYKAQRVINDSMDIDYIVNLGKRHKLVKVNISGNRYFDAQTIHERMYLMPASWQFRQGRYSESYLRRDEEAIRDLYKENGFRDVKVSSSVQDDYRGQTGQIAVEIRVEEGPQWLISQLDVAGIEQLPREEVISLLSSSPGQPFSELNVAIDRDSILTKYFSEGFPNAAFEWSSIPPAAPNRVDLRFVIREGERRFVRQVLTSGLDTTQPQLVNRNILLSPGDPLSQPKMVETQRRLYDLGIFSTVNTAIQNPEGETQNKFVLYQMDEANRFSIATGLGAQIGRIGGGNSLEAPAGTAGFSPRVSFDVSRLNFRGLGQTLSLRTRLSNVEQLGLVSYTIPRFRQAPNLTLTFTTLYDDTRNIRTFDAKREEGTVQVSQRLSKANTALYRFTYRHTSVSSLTIDPLLVPLLSQPVRIGLLAGSFIQDRRDDPTESHKGVYNTADLGFSSKYFGSQSGFVRFLGRNTTYHPVGKRLVVARSANFGWLLPIGTQLEQPPVQSTGDIFSRVALEDIPLAERFFSGGGNTHRGFPENQAGPRDSATGFPVGGQALLFLNAELRFPLIGDNVGGVLFWDAGNVYTRLRDISIRYRQPHTTQQVRTDQGVTTEDVFGFNYMAHAVGFGIRYRTPVGPIRLDLAFSPNSTHFAGCAGYTGDQLLDCGRVDANNQPLLPRKNDRINPFQFHFSIGQAF